MGTSWLYVPEFHIFGSDQDRDEEVECFYWSLVQCCMQGVIGVVRRRAPARVVDSVVGEVGRTPAIVGSMCMIFRSRKVCRFRLGSG